uniref:Autotransporter domain-containing protein n=1 Tax=Caulobacter sp. (strain K31) TaxID=366602 RepID=B0T2I1_CAUSK
MKKSGSGGREAGSPFEARLFVGAGLCALAWLASQGVARAQAANQNLGEVTAEVLAFGSNSSCGQPTTHPALLDAPPRDLLAQGKIGEQLAGICLFSAVTSGPSFGVSIGLRPTRSVTQYRLASARLNKRLAPKGRRSGLDHPILLASNGPVQIGDVGDTPGGWSVFAAMDYENRDQNQSHLDPGYSADIVEATVGVDKTLSPSLAVGFMVNYVDRRGDFARANLITAGDTPYPPTDVRTDADVLSLCGLMPGGDFKQSGWGGSAFVGYESDDNWYLRAVVNYAIPDHKYSRRVCGVEVGGTAATPANLKDSKDVFAGTLRAKSNAQELGLDLRAGTTLTFDAWVLRPELVLTAQRTKLDGYQEVGLASKTSYLCQASDVVSPTECGASDAPANAGDPPLRPLVIEAGKTPTGLEIRVGGQDTDSVQASLGFDISRPFAVGSLSVSPRVGATYVHEFADDAHDVAFQFAQDLRGAQARTYTFRTGDPDRDFGWINAGLSFVAANGAELDLEARTLVADERYDAWAVRALARLRF